MAKRVQARRWCFTLNNYTEQELASIEEWEVDYLIYGKETGENGTDHLQGYVELGSPANLGTMKNKLTRAHWETAKGNADQNITYCSKDGIVFERGVRKKQGARRDIQEAKELALTGGMRAVTEAAVNFQAIRIAEKYLTYHEKPRDWEPHVVWIWGPTGTGKSRDARTLVDLNNLYVKNTGSKWWDGYDGHHSVIIDDFRDSWWELTYMLGLLDRYGFKIECKGGMREFVARVIIVTSAQPPEACYARCGERIQQLTRRIKIISNYSPTLNPTTVATTQVGGVILTPPEDNVAYEWDDEWLDECEA